MPQDKSFDEVMARLRGGDEAAAAQVFRRFAQRLVALARSRLQPLMRQKVDPEDVLQSVFHSFFTRYAGGQFDLKSWDNLWTLLTVITLRKCGRRVGYFRAARRDARREAAVSPLESGTGWEAVARDPTPSQAAMLAEIVEHLLRGLEGRERQILVLSLQGRTVAEISTEVGCTGRTVRRVLTRVRDRLERMRAENE